MEKMSQQHKAGTDDLSYQLFRVSCKSDTALISTYLIMKIAQLLIKSPNNLVLAVMKKFA